MTELQPEIHIGDIGTKYRVRVRDEGGALDPSAATTKTLIFRLPDASVLEKAASVESDGSPATEYYLTYIVQAGDGIGSPPGEFHTPAGKLKVQAFLEWADGSQYHSNVQTVDEDGQELRIYGNLN